MKKEDLFDSLGGADDKLIERASAKMSGARKVPAWRRVILAAAACVVLLAISLSVVLVPLMKGDDGNGDVTPPVITDGYYPSGAEFLSMGIYPENQGYIPSVSVGTSTTEYSETNAVIIKFNCGAENTVQLDAANGKTTELALGEWFYQLYDDIASGKVDATIDLHGPGIDFIDEETTQVVGNRVVGWKYDTDSILAPEDDYIDYTVLDKDGEIIGAGCIYIVAISYVEPDDIYNYTHVSFREALEKYLTYGHTRAGLTVFKPVEIYSESFIDVEGNIDTQLRDKYFKFHDTVKSVRCAIEESEMIDKSRFNPTPRDDEYAELFMATPEQVALFDTIQSNILEDKLAGFDANQTAYYNAFAERRDTLRESVMQSVTPEDKMVLGESKIHNDIIGVRELKSDVVGYQYLAQTSGYGISDRVMISIYQLIDGNDSLHSVYVVYDGNYYRATDYALTDYGRVKTEGEGVFYALENGMRIDVSESGIITVTEPQN